jgi:hypothetical protein
MTDAPQKTPKPRRVATSLDDLAEPPIIVILEYEDYELEVKLHIPSAHEWNQIGYLVRNPMPPISGTDKQGRPVFDRNDPTYAQQMTEAEEERTYRRLLASLQLPIEGDTPAEKVERLKAKIGPNAFWKLNGLIARKVQEGDARIANRAETFHGGGVGDLAGVPGDEVDAGAI